MALTLTAYNQTADTRDADLKEIHFTLTVPQTRQLIHEHGSFVTTRRKQPDGIWKAVTGIATSEVQPHVK